MLPIVCHRGPWILASALACLFLMPHQTQAAASEPKIAGDSTVLVDGKTGTGTREVYLRNDAGTDLPLFLTTNVSSAKPSKLAISLSQVGSDPGSENLSLTLKKDGGQSVWITAKNAWDPGDTPVDLMDKDTKIGTLQIRRLPFSVKLDGASPDKAELSLLRYVETRIMLKNDGPVPYKLDWQMFLEGRVICAGKQVPVDPNGYGMLICNSSEIPFRFRHLLKDETANGVLYLGNTDFESAHSPPLKTFPVTASAYVWPDGVRHGVRYLLIFIILVAGGLFSLFLNQTLPNQIQKLNLKEQLLAVAKTTADLSTHIDSKLGVLVRLERARLMALLNSRNIVFPEFAAVGTQVSSSLAKLSTRVKLLQQMDVVMERLAKVSPQGSPPTLVDQVNDGLGTASVLLGKADSTDADIQAAQTALSTASTVVDSLTNPGADFGQTLAQRIQAASADIAPIFAKPSFSELQALVPGPWQTIQTAAQPTFKLSPALYASLDMALCKLRLMRDYSDMAEGTTDAARLDRLKAKKKDLTDYLQLDSFEALSSARILIREMKDDIYPERIRVALENGEAFIGLDPQVAYSQSPLTFTLCFRSKGLNEAAAREEWTCNWRFGDGLAAEGWEASHYYDLKQIRNRRPAADQKASENPPETKINKWEETATVVATFQDENGHDVMKSGSTEPFSVSLPVTVAQTIVPKSWERTWTEGLKLGAALLIAVFGLVAGAGDQIAKLDVLPALAAIFLLGFGADTIKNLFSPKPA
jgi:hypothetical protein